MPRNQIVGNLALAGFDDIFNPTVSAARNNHDGKIVEVPLSDLHPPEFHPFNVNDDEAMNRMAESVKQYGIREPGLARPRADNGFELLCGNRRKRACELAGLKSMPVIIRELDDNDATIVMVESNLQQREKIMPNEKAWAYKIMMEALNHSGIKGESHSYETMVERTGESKNQIFRTIRLTYLIVALADKVDAKQLAFNPAVELSYLSVTEQTAVADAMAAYEVKPSLSQAVQLKKLKQDGSLTTDAINEILSKSKEPSKSEPSSPIRYRKYFPPDYSQKQIDTVIIELLTDWKARVAV
jgi:ParB family chromosome partitioning protein